ncbi:MAG: MFS transporter [Pirellulaceae bacterium]|nr:MFS transporter [Pirellulaceae bacterium]
MALNELDKTPNASGAAADSHSETGATGFGRWMALIAALLGWMFDGAEMGVFSMVGRSAVQDMLGFDGAPTKGQEEQIGFYFSIIIAVFLVGAATGGVLFGWLGDRIGRVRAMSLSVLTYALFTGLCGLAQDPVQLGILRFIAALGMGGEWALGVALVMEVWPNRSRALMAGLIGAAANFGYMLVGVIGLMLAAVLVELERTLSAIGFTEATVQMLIAHKGWRLMMMLGTLPALLTFFIRIFVPESHKREQEKGKGNTNHWATVDLLDVLVGGLGPRLSGHRVGRHN